jgi:hypothetical protein
MLEPLDIDGKQPNLDGLRCAEFLCQEFWCHGELCDRANVVYLKFGENWHRLYFDCGIVFWRPNDGRPEEWSADEIGGRYPLVDIASRFSLNEEVLDRVETESIEGGSRVSFVFQNGSRLIFENVADRSTYYYLGK